MPDFDPIGILTPITFEEFTKTYLERKLLHLKRGNPEYFSSVVDLKHLDEIVTSIRIPPTNLNLAKDNLPLPLEDYCIGNSYVDKSQVLEHHRNGATIILRSIEQWSSCFARLREAIENLFGCECQVNLYFTPASQKSTPPHWDTHDLIILQLVGQKMWRLFETDRTLPLADERFRTGIDVVGSKTQEILVSQGDTMYLPRGIVHEPVASSYSVHASIGVHTVRWVEMVEVMLQLLSRQEGMALRMGLEGHGGFLDQLSHFDWEIFDDPILQERAKEIISKRSANSRQIIHSGALLEEVYKQDEKSKK